MGQEMRPQKQSLHVHSLGKRRTTCHSIFMYPWLRENLFIYTITSHPHFRGAPCWEIRWDNMAVIETTLYVEYWKLFCMCLLAEKSVVLLKRTVLIKLFCWKRYIGRWNSRWELKYENKKMIEYEIFIKMIFSL